MFNKFLNNLILLIVVLSIFLGAYSYYKYQESIRDPLIKQISKNIVVELPEYYTHSVDNAYLTSYILKTGVFALDKTVTLDGFYHKDWLPLAFNYCSLLNSDAFQVDNDFDNDNIPNVNDTFPYDYSNGDYAIRKSNTLDFDGDGITNNLDKDADGNDIEDIFQGICLDRVTNKDQIKKLYPKKAQDLFLTHKEDIVEIITDSVYIFLDTYKVEDPFESEEHFNDFIQGVFDKLLFDDDLIIEFGDKNLILKKKDIISQLHSQGLVDYYDE